jgi:hypothetical protein
MLPAIALFSSLVLILAAAIVIASRKRARIVSEINALGHTFKSMRHAKSGRRVVPAVVYVSNMGDLRYALPVLRRGKLDLTDDEPYETYFWRIHPFDISAPPQKIQINALLWAAESSKLPGNEAYKKLVLQLCGEHSTIELEELRPSDSTENGASFAAILQRVRWDSMPTNEGKPGIIDLQANGRPLRMEWRVEGVRPNRTLVLSTKPGAIEEAVRDSRTEPT